MATKNIETFQLPGMSYEAYENEEQYDGTRISEDQLSKEQRIKIDRIQSRNVKFGGQTFRSAIFGKVA